MVEGATPRRLSPWRIVFFFGGCRGSGGWLALLDAKGCREQLGVVSTAHGLLCRRASVESSHYAGTGLVERWPVRLLAGLRFFFGRNAAESSLASSARLRWCMYFIVVCTSA